MPKLALVFLFDCFVSVFSFMSSLLASNVPQHLASLWGVLVVMVVADCFIFFHHVFIRLFAIIIE